MSVKSCPPVCQPGSPCSQSAAEPPAATHSATPKMATLEAASRQAGRHAVKGGGEGPGVKQRSQQLSDTTPACFGVCVSAGTGSAERLGF